MAEKFVDLIGDGSAEKVLFFLGTDAFQSVVL